MLPETHEFQISQYADGSLPDEQREFVETLVRENSGAAEVLRQYRRMDLHLAGLKKEHAIDWSALANRLSHAVYAQTVDALEETRPSIAGRIFPVISNWQFRSAIAAVVLVAVGLPVWMRMHRTVTNLTVIPVESTSIVAGPQAEVASGPVVQDISVGPSPGVAMRMRSWHLDGVVSRGPSQVTITAAEIPASAHPDPRLR